MPAKSKAQQRFFALVRQCQETNKCASKEIKKVADSISPHEAEKFAKTKRKNLPEHKIKEGVAMLTLRDFMLIESDVLEAIKNDERFLDLPKGKQVALLKKISGMSAKQAEEALQQAWEAASRGQDLTVGKDKRFSKLD